MKGDYSHTLGSRRLGDGAISGLPTQGINQSIYPRVSYIFSLKTCFFLWILTSVYPQRATTNAYLFYDFSVVAVHGLGGDAIDTWTHPESNAFWLKDFLPQQVPGARILTFGYNAAAAFSDSTAEVIDHAKSLLASLVDKREEAEVLAGQVCPLW